MKSNFNHLKKMVASFWSVTALLSVNPVIASDIPFPTPTFTFKGASDVSIAWNHPVAAIVNKDKAIEIFNLPEGKTFLTLKPDGGAIFITLSPDGKKLAATSPVKTFSQAISVYTLPKGKLLFKETFGMLDRPKWAGTQNKLILSSVGSQSRGSLWTIDGTTGKKIEDVGSNILNPQYAAVSKDGKKLAYDALKVLNFDTKAVIQDKLPHTEAQKSQLFAARDFSPKDGFLWVAGRNSAPLMVFNSDTGEFGGTIQQMGASPFYHQLKFSPDNEFLFALDWSELHVYSIPGLSGVVQWPLKTSLSLDMPHSETISVGKGNWMALGFRHRANEDGSLGFKQRILIFGPDKLKAIKDHSKIVGQRMEIFKTASAKTEAELQAALKQDSGLATHQDTQKNFLLHVAAYKNFVSLATDLIALNKEVTISNAHGQTPLHLAALQGNTDIATFLIAQGAKMDSVDFKGNYPFNLAILGKHKGIITLFLDKGFNVFDFKSVFEGNPINREQERLFQNWKAFKAANLEFATWFESEVLNR